MRVSAGCVALATVVVSTACYSMRPVTLDELGVGRAPRVWVTRPDQSVVLVNDAQIFRGMLVGFVEGKYQELPPGDLQGLQVRKLAAGRTLSLIAAGVLGFTVGAVLLAGRSNYFDSCAGGEEECEGM